MYSKTLLLFQVLGFDALPLVLAQNDKDDTILAANIIKAAMSPAASSDLSSTDPETIFRQAWPQLWFYNGQSYLHRWQM